MAESSILQTIVQYLHSLNPDSCVYQEKVTQNIPCLWSLINLIQFHEKKFLIK